MLKTLKNFKKYSYLLQQLVIRDFKVKYKRSILGVLWSVLNPLLTMIVLTVVFEGVMQLRGNSTIKSYPVFLLSGLLFWNYFSEATSLAMGAVVNNFNLITKVYMPKYIFPLSKVLSSAINFVFSLVALYVILFFQPVQVTWLHVFLPLDMIYVIIFAMGVALFLSAITVFFRDMFYIYSVVITMWMYMTPIIYSIDTIQNSKYHWFMMPLMKLNPMYYYITYARNIILDGQLPTLHLNLICLAASLLTLLIGALFFRWKQDRFIYYI
ncbi:ABC transporter permease [Ethanoligenens harbinense]|uniref:Transport permease protein n=1 Tax=Ethanoligenens harbinense (strain DSM 18485 / JCM 12961 / CGMCC 1.5033 / YUAN-3) TaxID=663278 RepID=E6U853_ETHHY|nr:ABC transporter permease [Ethanoligenens harbinense]ADU27072.1 ABC-2 type transporter [Ethanoligenens harbinense YUAN-3]AVQ96151.1 ABC transporter permease [Ethanoligenens harbinense YUAN-3]AYF38811.1 ABC transporter permease [Ethanoligenens harbinense]AYF41561.1 ABC transporter permease [Ethanoligenens harbinense]QCN92392.1 ABC transporter permease [Ethanoligenens harbinense]